MGAPLVHVAQRTRPEPAPAPTGLSRESRREVLGRTPEGRPIEAWVLGGRTAELRIAAVGGQHGDEPWGSEAVRRWWGERAARTRAPDLDAIVGIAAIPSLHPDGAARHTRRNALGNDLNRDHLLLQNPETRAFHRFLRAYRPHLVVDVHNYPPRRRHLLAQGWEIDADVQVGTPTHPAVRTSLGVSEVEDLYSTLGTSLARAGYRSGRYTLFHPSGRARPGTLHVVDARNGIALRYGIPTVLLEGRDPGRGGTESDRERTITAQQRALEVVEEWARDHRSALERGPPIPRRVEPVAVDAGWGPGASTPEFVFRRTPSGDRVSVPWPAHRGAVLVRSSVLLPRAYAVRTDLVAVHRLLAAHGFEADGDAPGPRALAEVPRPASSRGRGLPPQGTPPEASDLDGYVVYSVHQRGGHALAVWLEPSSQYGLARLGLLGDAPASGDRPGVLRVLGWGYPAPPVPPPGPEPTRRSPWWWTEDAPSLSFPRRTDGAPIAETNLLRFAEPAGAPAP